MSNLSREERRQLERENARRPLTLAKLPRSEWEHMARPGMIEVWRSREYLLQVYQEAGGVIRLTFSSTSVIGNSMDWQDGLTWDVLQRLKRECGRGDLDAVEVYPADRDVVNVANMRHLWLLPAPLTFCWRRN